MRESATLYDNTTDFMIGKHADVQDQKRGSRWREQTIDGNRKIKKGTTAAERRWCLTTADEMANDRWKRSNRTLWWRGGCDGEQRLRCACGGGEEDEQTLSLSLF